MKKIIVPFFLSFLLASCGDDSGSSAKSSETSEGKVISGVAQLGPFEKGSTISAYELDKSIKQTGFNIESAILNDDGEFSVKLKDFESQYALLKVDGYYRRTITGERASEKEILYALADLNERSQVNINILTHLSHKRAIYLANEKGMSFAEAKKQAEAEVLKSFGIDEEFDDAEALNIIGKDNQSIALLVMSILMQSDMTETELSDRLKNYTTDIEGDGAWDDEITIAKIADWAYKVYNLSAFGAIKEHVKKWNSSVVFATFEKYVNAFWHHNYGLEICTDDRINEVRKNKLYTSDFYDKYFICRPGGKWKESDEQQVNKFFKAEENATDGDIRTIKIPGNYYTECQVFEDGEWRKGNDNDCYRGLEGCTKKREGIVKTSAESYLYVCKNQNWTYIEDLKYFTEPIKFDLDTIGWKDTTDGAIKKGNITDIIYIFDNDAWRVANLPEASLGKCSKDNLDSAGYAEYRDEQTKFNPLEFVCQYNMKISGFYYGSCPNNKYQSGYYRCGKADFNDSKDTIYAWSYVDDICTLQTYDLIDGKLNRWNNGKQGDFRWGHLWRDDENPSTYTKTCGLQCYKYSNGTWYYASLWQCLGLGTCDENVIGKVKQGSTLKYEKGILVKVDSLNKRNYVCRGPNDYEEYDYSWHIANDIDVKTSQLKCTRDGALVSTKTEPDELYVCDKSGFREATKEEKIIGLGCTDFTNYKEYVPKGLKSYFYCIDYDDFEYAWYLDPEKNKGTMTDPRDGSNYKTSNIGSKTWMMESLNYSDSTNYPSMLGNSKCEDDNLDNCKKYGRLYTWSAIIDSVYWASNGKTCGNTKDNDKKCEMPDVVQGICPKGWHVPSIQEWEDLASWMNAFSTNGYDGYGFLHKDYREYFFWTSIDSTGSIAYSNLLDLFEPELYFNIRSTVSKTKDTHLAVRCVKDD